MWTDFGAEYTNDCSAPLQTAREAVESFVDVSLGASSVELTGVQEPLITKHYLVDCAAPPTPHPGLNFVMKRFTRMPPGSQLHPNLRGIKPTVVKRVLGEAKDHGWRIEGGTGYGVNERSFHTAGIIIVSPPQKKRIHRIHVYSSACARPHTRLAGLTTPRLA